MDSIRRCRGSFCAQKCDPRRIQKITLKSIPNKSTTSCPKVSKRLPKVIQNGAKMRSENDLEEKLEQKVRTSIIKMIYNTLAMFATLESLICSHFWAPKIDKKWCRKPTSENMLQNHQKYAKIHICGCQLGAQNAQFWVQNFEKFWRGALLRYSVPR